MIEIPITLVVLAAGKGTRLGSLTLAHSKAMTPILGVPVLQRVMEAFARNGVREFVVVASPDDRELIEWAGDFSGSRINLRLAFQKERKGTAHALLMARPYVRQDFIITSCDNLYSDEHVANLITAHLTHKPPSVITIADFSPPDLDRCAGVRLQGTMVEEILEKPGRDSTGWDAISKFLFSFRKELLDCLDAVEPSPRGEHELQDAVKMFMGMCDEYCRAVKAGSFLHLTSVDDLLDIHRHYLDHHRPFIIHPEAKIESGVSVSHPVMIDRGARVRSGAKLGPYVYVGAGAEVAAGARVERSVVYPGARVKAGKLVNNEVVVELVE